MEISSIDEPHYEENLSTPIEASLLSGSQDPLGEKIGRVLLGSSVFFTGCAFVPLRKKQISPTPLASSSSPLQSPEPIAWPASTEAPELLLPQKTVPSNVKQKAPLSYENLYCPPEDQKKIGWIITTVDEGGIDLIWKKGKLDEVGEEIFPVHPYKFLTTILLDPLLRNRLKHIFNYKLPFKKIGFLGGVKRGMEREAANLETYIHEFASELGTTAQAIRPLMQAGDWNALVVHLLEKNPKQMNRTFQA